MPLTSKVSEFSVHMPFLLGINGIILGTLEVQAGITLQTRWCQGPAKGSEEALDSFDASDLLPAGRAFEPWSKLLLRGVFRDHIGSLYMRSSVWGVWTRAHLRSETLKRAL